MTVQNLSVPTPGLPSGNVGSTVAGFLRPACLQYSEHLSIKLTEQSGIIDLPVEPRPVQRQRGDVGWLSKKARRAGEILL